MARKRLAKWFREANARRGELIMRHDDLTPAEQAELDELQKRTLVEVERVFPGPSLGPDVGADGKFRRAGL